MNGVHQDDVALVQRKSDSRRRDIAGRVEGIKSAEIVMKDRSRRFGGIWLWLWLLIHVCFLDVVGPLCFLGVFCFLRVLRFLRMGCQRRSDLALAVIRIEASRITLEVGILLCGRHRDVRIRLGNFQGWDVWLHWFHHLGRHDRV